MITRLDIYTDGDDSTARDSIIFTDAGKAEDARVALFEDDGLAGIIRIAIVTVPTDDDGVEAFYDRLIEDL